MHTLLPDMGKVLDVGVATRPSKDTVDHYIQKSLNYCYICILLDLMTLNNKVITQPESLPYMLNI